MVSHQYSMSLPVFIFHLAPKGFTLQHLSFSIMCSEKHRALVHVLYGSAESEKGRHSTTYQNMSATNMSLVLMLFLVFLFNCFYVSPPALGGISFYLSYF